ncbi:plasmid mobilization relaxosome protein MobC [Brevundimonas vesicularis]|uniref:plasmid mobilization relaxosome protein MobC n=1 Tax=Brevundimonas vesicularis TaxID=41276 RepID=UPI003B007E91
MTLRLGEADLRLLEREAAATGLSRTQWSVALIRRRLHDRPQFSRPEALTLIEVRRELRRIGVNINQIARALNTAVMDGAVLDLELAQLGAFQAEISAWVEALGEAFEGNLAYWAPAS